MTKRSREMFTNTNNLCCGAIHTGDPAGFKRQFGIGNRKAGENAHHALLFEAKADIVIFGQALHVKGNAIAVFQKGDNGAAAKTGANTGTGNLAGQGLANDNVLAVIFGKFIGIMTGGKPPPFRWIGVNRHLDQVLFRQQIVKQPQFHW